MNSPAVLGAMTAVALAALAVWGCKGKADAPEPRPGAATSCAITVPSGSDGCPETHPAEVAWSAVDGACGLDFEDDLRVRDPASGVTLTSSGGAKICDSCACRQAIGVYYGHYQGCEDQDQGNANLARALYGAATACED